MKKKYKKIFYDTLRIRLIESEIANRYNLQKMRCPVHLSIGQEAVPVGISSNLKTNDKIVTAHRSHAHYLAKGGNLNKMIAELHGKKTGCARGKGGSMHLIDLEAGVEAAVPIVGSTIPIGVGISWGIKLNRKKNLCVIFFGDGATEEGVFLESLDFASLHQLPVLFVCEDNNFSVYSNKLKRQSTKRDIIKIANGVGIDGKKIDGNDVFEIHKKTKKIINTVRSKSKPYIISFDTFRHLEHCGPNNDDNLNYREKKYISKWIKKCPIAIAEKYLIKNNFIKKAEIENFKKKIKTEIDKSFLFAENSKFPNFDELKKDIYA